MDLLGNPPEANIDKSLWDSINKDKVIHLLKMISYLQTKVKSFMFHFRNL